MLFDVEYFQSIWFVGHLLLPLQKRHLPSSA